MLTNAALLAVLALLGQPWLYGIWLVAWLTSHGLFLRLRAIAEHACTELSGDLFHNTRTTRASWALLRKRWSIAHGCGHSPPDPPPNHYPSPTSVPP